MYVETDAALAGYAHAQDKTTFLEELYHLSQHNIAQRRTLHLLAWDFWTRLDVRTDEAEAWMQQHMHSLTLHGAPDL